MKNLLILLAILIIPAFSASAQSDYKTYGNARFGFKISYPAKLLEPQGEADNGDGQAFAGDGAEMRVYGSNLLANETLLREFNAVVSEYGARVSYRTYRKTYFVVSALGGGKIFYRKTIARADGSFITFEIEYDESRRAVYDPAVEKIVKSFK